MSVGISSQWIGAAGQIAPGIITLDKLTPGTALYYMRMNSGGTAWEEAAPAASTVCASGYGGGDSTGNAAFDDIVMTEDYDSSGAYDGTTFTVPAGQAGIYEIDFWVQGVASTSGTYDFTCKIAGSDDTTHQIEMTGSLASSGYLHVAHYHRLVSLAAGNAVVCRAKHSTAARVLTTYWFSIKKV